MDDVISDCYNALDLEAFGDCEKKTPNSQSCLSCFQNQYFDSNEISYDCEEKRRLYLLRYFVVHCMENYHGAANISCDVIDEWFDFEHVSILSVGGGPGSDVCGVLKYLRKESERREVDLSVDVVRLDIEAQWDEVFNNVMGRLFPWADYRNVHLDVNDGFDFISDKSFDLVTVSYLTSELNLKECLKLADELNSVLVRGGVLIINDRPEDLVEQNIRLIFDRIQFVFEKLSLRDWAGYNYPNDIAKVVGPKFNMNSSMFVGVKG